MYVCDDAHYEIIETIFEREDLDQDEVILDGEVEISDDESECIEDLVT